MGGGGSGIGACGMVWVVGTQLVCVTVRRTTRLIRFTLRLAGLA